MIKYYTPTQAQAILRKLGKDCNLPVGGERITHFIDFDNGGWKGKVSVSKHEQKYPHGEDLYKFVYNGKGTMM